MKINLRQGIVRYQKDTQNNQQFLLETSTGIDLITTNDPTIVSFAHKNRNYLYTEKRSVRNAWIGPFESNKDYWLYWDLDVKTGVRTFGHTTIPPIVDSNAPKNPPIDQHWFDTETDMMMVYNGVRFKERIRVFAAKYTDGTVIDSYFGNSLFGGSQIGVNSMVEAGSLLFDDADKPLKRGDGTFITTTDELASGVPTASNIKIEALKFAAVAATNIGAYHIVYLNDFDSILPATPLNIHNVPFGIIEEDAYTGELVNVTTDGVICNPNWNWQEAGAELYIDNAGRITDTRIVGMLPIGYVISKSEILLKTSGVTQVTIEGGQIGGAVDLDGLTDVTITEPAPGDQLMFDIESNSWINRSIINIPPRIEDLTNVEVTEASDGDILVYRNEIDGWVTESIPPSLSTLTELTDVEVQIANHNDVLQFDIETSQWLAKPLPSFEIGPISLNDIDGVATGDVMDGSILTYSQMSDSWVASRLPEQEPVDVPETVGDLLDTDVGSANHNDVMQFNAETNTWIANSLPEQVPVDVPDKLNDLSDVAVGFATHDHFLVSNDGVWVSRAVSSITDSIPSVMEDLEDVTLTNVNIGDQLLFVPGFEGEPPQWRNVQLPPETAVQSDGRTVGGRTTVDAWFGWTTLRCTADTELEFDFSGVSYSDVVEFSLELYPGSHAITWPPGIIGDTSITANKINIFTFVRRKQVAGLAERLYCMKVVIENDNVDPIFTPPQ